MFLLFLLSGRDYILANNCIFRRDNTSGRGGRSPGDGGELQKGRADEGGGTGAGGGGIYSR